MDFTLTRTESNENGIFGELKDSAGKHFCYTLEHPYPTLGGLGFNAKIPLKGSFKCIRGVHQLEHGAPFETFEVTGVPNCTGILLHIGNYATDSHGCILVGNLTSPNMILESKDAFARFMAALDGVNEFTLTVS